MRPVGAKVLPHPMQFWRTAMLRGGAAWLAVRFALALLAAMAGRSVSLEQLFEIGPFAAACLVLIAGGLAQMHGTAMKERLFLSNLGGARGGYIAAVAAAGALELAFRILFASGH